MRPKVSDGGPDAFPVGGGSLGAMIRARDWSRTLLGPVSSWSPGLKTTVGLMLTANAQIVLFWGPHYVALYNDAYAPTIGDKHPRALGRPAIENWTELWDDLEPLLRGVRETGETFAAKDRPFYIERRGYGETVYFDVSYSAVPEADGSVGGVLCIVSETTGRVRAERLQAFRLRLEERLRDLVDPVAITSVAAEMLGTELEVARVGYGEVDAAQTNVIVARDWTDGGVSSVAGAHRMDDFGPAIIDELRAGRVMSVDDVDADARVGAAAAAFSGIGTRSVLAAPLIKGGRLVSILFAHHSAPRRWREEDRALALDVAERTWAAVERARAEARLRDSERELRTLASALPVVVSFVDAERRYRYANPTFERWFGRPPESVYGMHISEIVGEAAYETVRDKIDRALSGERISFEQLIPYKYGGARYVHVEYIPRLSESGAVEGYYALVQDISERKRAAALFEGVFNSDLMGFTIFDAQSGETLAINDRFLAMTGHSREDFETGRWDWHDFTLPEHLDLDARAIAQAKARGWWDPYEKEYRRLDGGVFPVRISSAPLPGEPGRVVVSVEDITERRAAQRALQELNVTLERRVSEALAERKLLADIVEATDASVHLIDHDYRLLAINGPGKADYLRLYGVKASVGDRIPDLLAHAPANRDAAMAVWARALAGEAFTSTDWWGGEGQDRQAYEVRLRPMRDAAGRQIGAFLFGINVTERLLAQERLAAAEAARREADALYRAYFENTAEALFVVNVLEDGGFTVEDLNRAHEIGVGLPLSQVKGKRIDDILPPDVASVVIKHYQRVLETGEVHQYRDEFELNGRRTHWDTSLVPVRDESGRIVRLIGSSRDLTRQIAAEEQLRHVQKMESMGQLTGGVAHDFNNLLTPIVGALDALQRKGIGGERERRLIAGAAQSAERAKALVQRLLAFARRQPLQPAPVDIRDLVLGMAELLATTAGPQIEVRVEAAEDLPPARADANQLEMALLNLGVNARDAMANGGTLRISATAERVEREHRTGLPPGRYVRLSVADTGIGMDEETRQRAVEPFFSTKGVGRGTGLGLSMAHGLAEQLGGALTIDSRLGLGTNVQLWLPVSAAPAETPAPAPASSMGSQTRGVALLVDDEELARASTADMLSEIGFEVVEAANAAEALRLIRDGLKPSVLVTDHLMPGMNGTDLARRVLAEHPGVEALIVSGYTDVEGVAPDLPRLAKPFRRDELAASLSSPARA